MSSDPPNYIQSKKIMNFLQIKTYKDARRAGHAARSEGTHRGDDCHNNNDEQLHIPIFV